MLESRIVARVVILVAALVVACPARGRGAIGASPDSVGATRLGHLRVYVDCDACDLEFLRTQITFVEHVRDRAAAQVHVLVTSQPTGGGGQEHTLDFIGQREYASLADTLRFVSRESDTEDTIRRGLTRMVEVGLVRFVARTPVARDLQISYTPPARPAAPAADRWDHWVFSTSVNGWFNGEESRRFISMYGNLSARRVTLASKIEISVYGNHNESRFDLPSGRIVSISRSRGLSCNFAWSLTDHWSAGAWTATSSSTFRNRRISVEGGPALEYDVFPYSESTRRQLRLTYRPGYDYVEYRKETLFGQTAQGLASESVSAALDLKEPWGTTSVRLEGSHYFYDFRKNRLEAGGDFTLRLVKGLSIRLSGNASRVRDQLSLPRAGATEEEVLLQRRQLATQYEYYGSMGLSYTFGSIYSEVVNPRFGF